MPSNIDLDALFSPPPEEESAFQREERCRKALNTVGKAIFMRLIVTGLMVFIAVKAQVNFGVGVLLLLVLVINVSGMLPLTAEWKRKKEELNKILDEE